MMMAYNNNYGPRRDFNRPETYKTSLSKITQTGYVDEAEKVIKSLSESKSLLSTSKIRNILSLVSDLSEDIKRVDLDSKEIVTRCNYIRMRFAYEAGRDNKVKDFVNNALLMDILKQINDRSTCSLFCNYMEALVAYHKYYGGKD